MYAIIEYDRVSKSLVSVRFSDNLALKDTFNSNGATPTCFAYKRVTESDADVLTRLLNNPTAASIQINADTVEISKITAGDSKDPYVRKIADSDLDKSVRPAAYRAGTVSFFKNI